MSPPQDEPVWRGSAEAMEQWASRHEGPAARADARLLRAAAPRPGERVLEVGAGTGRETLLLARAVGPQGHVLATDLSAEMVTAAAAKIAAAGLGNVTLEAMDAAALDVPRGQFDLAFCRMGLMLFADPAAALRGLFSALRLGGRLAAMVFGAPARNPVHAVSLGVLRERLGLPAPAEDAPGYFRFGAEGALEAALADAGFAELRVERVGGDRSMTPAELRGFLSGRAGGIRALLADADPAARDEALRAAEAALAPHRRGEIYVFGQEFLIATGFKQG